MHRRLLQFAHFGLIGGVAFIVDIGVYNLLRVTLLDDKPIGAKVVSVAVATIVAWIGNRYLTFRTERGRPVMREAFLFGVMNVIGLGIAASCLYVSHYVLGFQSQLADNIAGNGVGLVLGMAFRFLAYRYVVFAGPGSATARTARRPDGAPGATAPAPLPSPPARPTTRKVPLPGPS